MNATKKFMAPVASYYLLAGAMCFSFASYGQCTRTIAGPTVVNISVLPGETVCVSNDLVVTTTVSVASGGRLVIAPRVRVLTEDVYSYGAIDMGDHSYLDVQSGANFEGLGAVTTMGIGATIFVCNGVNVVFGATVHMGPMSVFDSFNTTMAFSTDYFHYTGPSTGTPQAHLVARTSMIVNGTLTSDSEIGYCGSSAGTNLTPAQLGAAQLYCTPLIPPAVMAAMHCSAVSPYYYTAVLPVRFESFNVQSFRNNINQIRWTVDEDQTILHYVLEKKQVNDSFSFVRRHTAGTTHTALTTYTIYDTIRTPGFSETQYRIRAFRRDGSYFESPVRRVRNELLVAALTIWPNPVKDQLHIVLPQPFSESGSVHIQVLNSVGAIMYSQHMIGYSPVFTIPSSCLTRLPTGYYYAKVNTEKQVYVAGFSRM